MIKDLDGKNRSPEMRVGGNKIYHTKFKFWGSNMEVINHLRKDFLSANSEGKSFTVWLKLDLIFTNLQFTDQIRPLN